MGHGDFLAGNIGIPGLKIETWGSEV
jgi:hypothetical protein